MKFARKALAGMLTLALVGSAVAASAETPENVTNGQTVISREFREHLFDKPWQDELGAVVRYENLDVVKNGNEDECLLIGGIREEDEDGPISSIAPENQKEGFIVYKLSIDKETRELGVGMIYLNNDTDSIQVFISDSETFPETPTLQFHGPVNEYNAEFRNVPINADGKETVYVKLLLPYGGLKENGKFQNGVRRLILTPENRDILHTTDTNGKNNGDAVLFSDLIKANEVGTYDPWGFGMYGFSGWDEENHIYPPNFKVDREQVFCASQTYNGQWGYSPRTSYIVYKVNTVSAMEEAVLTAHIRVANSSADSGEYAKEGCGDDVEAFYMEYSTDGETWKPAAEKVGDKSGNQFLNNLTATLTAEELDGTDTLYVRVTSHIVAWPDWAYMNSLKIETKGANPEKTEPENPPESTESKPEDPGESEPEDPTESTESKPETSTESTESKPADDQTGSPETGVAGGAGAAAILAISAAGVLLIQKRKRQ